MQAADGKNVVDVPEGVSLPRDTRQAENAARIVKLMEEQGLEGGDAVVACFAKPSPVVACTGLRMGHHWEEVGSSSGRCLVADTHHCPSHVAANASQRSIAAVVPATVSHLIVSSTVNVPAGIPAATAASQTVVNKPRPATMSPAELASLAAARSPCMTSEMLVVMPQEGQGRPVSACMAQGGKPSCR